MQSGALFRRCKAARICVQFFFTLAAAVSLVSLQAQAQGEEDGSPLDLNSAISEALSNHPNLQMLALRQQGLAGARRSADLSPVVRVEAEVENFAGSGEMEGFDGSEQTLALSSVIELGDKREARVAVVDARQSLLETRREMAALDLAGQVTRRFVEVLAAQELLQLAQQNSELSGRTLQIVRRRAAAGGTPEAEVLRAEANSRRAELALAQAQRQSKTQRVKLAALLGETTAEFTSVSGDLFHLPDADDFDQLYQRAQNNPALVLYADEERLAEAEMELARSHATADVDWRLGLRRMDQSGDTGLVASLSVPIFTERRNRGERQSAQAQREQVEYHKQQALLTLHAQLYEAYLNWEQNSESVRTLQDQVIPALTEALALTERAYENGRYSYIDWVAAQEELLDARRGLIEAAASALSHIATIEQLTAEPISAADARE